MKDQVINLKIVGGTNFARYPKITNEKTVNMMVTNSGDIQSLIDSAGYCKKIDFGMKGQPRALYKSTRIEALIAVIGQNVILINAAFSWRIVGELDTFSGPVYIAENLAGQVGIVDGLALYVYNYNLSTFQRVDIPDVTPAYISFLDTYFILTDTNQNQWQISDSDQGTSYDPLMIAFLQTQADFLQAVVPLNRTLWVMGKKVSELWNDNPTGYNASGIGSPVSFPFQRNNSIAVNYGVLSVPTICSAFQMLVWLAYNDTSGPTIVSTTGGNPEELSTDGLDYVLKNVINFPEKSWANLRKENGHIIYQITFYDPSDNLTIQYDFSTKLWSNCTDENQNIHIMKQVSFFQDQQYFINYDQDNPALYLLDSTLTTYDGAIIPRIRVCPPIRQGDKLFIIRNIELQMEQGDSDDFRYIDMSFSKDGGERFGNWLRYDMLPVGHRKGRVNFWNCGMANDFRPQFMFLTSGRIVVLGGTVRILV